MPHTRNPVAHQPQSVGLASSARPTAGPSGRDGLYDPAYEHDACGVGLVADLTGKRGHGPVAQALTVLANLDHRGAKGADPDTGDGAGILTQLPDEFFRAVLDFTLPPLGQYAAGMVFLPAGAGCTEAVQAIEELAKQEGLEVLGWRAVPHESAACGTGARAVLPTVVQLFVRSAKGESGLVLDRRAFCLRQRAEHETDAYFVTLSSATIVYKGMLTALQLDQFFPDLTDHRFTSALALAHARFSTNTFPSWPLAHPFRFLAHNGEINTIRGNRNWMARQRGAAQQRPAAWT